MKKILNIKWGLIFGLIFGGFSVYAMIYHQVLNGLHLDKLLYEFLIYGSFVFVNSYGIEYIRKDIKKEIR